MFTSKTQYPVPDINKVSGCLSNNVSSGLFNQTAAVTYLGKLLIQYNYNHDNMQPW